jgi:hypothetical protein
MSRKRIYIAGPISLGNLAENVNRATAAFVSLGKEGLAPFAPAWSVYSKPCSTVTRLIAVADTDVLDPTQCVCIGTRNGNSEMVHSDWLDIDLAWVSVADAVLRLPGESKGADTEVAHARSLGIPVFQSVEEVIAWAKAA